MKYRIILFFVFLIVSCKKTDHTDYFVEGVSDPIISLNGTWKVNIESPEEFWKTQTLNDEWKNIEVPGECMMQGFPIKHDKPFVYKKLIDIPNDYDEQNALNYYNLNHKEKEVIHLLDSVLKHYSTRRLEYVQNR